MTTRFAIGYVQAAHGVKGDLRVVPLCDAPGAWLKGHSIYRDPTEVQAIGEITRVAVSGCKMTLHIAGVDTRDDAQALVHATLYVARDAVPALEPGTWFLADLIGCDVVDTRDGPLGRIVAIDEGPAQDRLVVRHDDAADLLVPAVGALLADVDLVAGRVTVSLPDGLLALYRP